MLRGHMVRARGRESRRTTASPGPAGTNMAQHMRNVLAYPQMATLTQPKVFIEVNDDFFEERGDIADPDTNQFLQGWMDRYTAWVKRFATH